MRLPKPTIITAIMGSLTLASIAGTTGYLLGRYPALPPVLAVEFRRGVAFQFMRKSYGTALTPVWTQLLLLAVFGSIAAVLLWRAHGIHQEEHDAADAERMLYAAEAISLLGFVWISFQVMTAIGLTQLWTRFSGGMGRFYNAALLTAIGLSIVIAIRAKLQFGTLPIRTTEDRGQWRLKKLYFNPSDPALFVPARKGRGLTVNFGRPLAIFLILIILVAGLGAPMLLARAFLR